VEGFGGLRASAQVKSHISFFGWGVWVMGFWMGMGICVGVGGIYMACGKLDVRQVRKCKLCREFWRWIRDCEQVGVEGDLGGL